MNRKKIQDTIIFKAVEYGLRLNDRGYVECNMDNLMCTDDLWNEIKLEIDKGNGSELKTNQRNNLAKFNAVYSSSALCVNNFFLFKSEFNNIIINGYSGFNEAVFEKKLSTGISRPNLDFYLENEEVIIGIESKFTEILTGKLPNARCNLEKYWNNDRLKYLDQSFMDLIDYYINKTQKSYLDCAQLIKHSIGLINEGKKKMKKPVLIYIYWLPINWLEFELFNQHNKEIEEFKTVVKGFIDFVPMSYIDFWENYEIQEKSKEMISEIRKRYEFNI